MEAALHSLFAALNALEALGRHFDPLEPDAMLDAIGEPEAALGEGWLGDWPADEDDARPALEQAAGEIRAAFATWRAGLGTDDAFALYRALRHAPRAQEALYPLAHRLPAVSAFFLDPEMPDPEARAAQLAGLAPGRDTGLGHARNELNQRGGFSIYAPEDYTPARAWPLVMVLHGGRGHGRSMLWTWVRDARSYGAIVAAPTSMGETWALSGFDNDTANLARILDLVSARWNIDPARRLLAGVSDGGTFAYMSGLRAGSPFTHLSPAAAAYNPLVEEHLDMDRLQGLPIFIVHGANDWMFPVESARIAAQRLGGGGARVRYEEAPDLGHGYPREINSLILDWLAE